MGRPQIKMRSVERTARLQMTHGCFFALRSPYPILELHSLQMHRWLQGRSKMMAGCSKQTTQKPRMSTSTEVELLALMTRFSLQE